MIAAMFRSPDRGWKIVPPWRTDMIKGVTATLGLSAVLLFGYFYLVAPADRGAGDRAKEAGRQMVEATRDKGAAVVVQTRLTAKLGIDAMRLVHVHFEHGKALVYGLVPAGTDEAGIVAAARECPGVSEVELMLLPRPAYVEPLKSIQLGGGTNSTPPPAESTTPAAQP